MTEFGKDRHKKSSSAFEKSYSEIIDNVPDLMGLGDYEGEKLYLEAMRSFYDRVYRDILDISHEGSVVIELGAYLGVVSLALKNSGFKVTACDIPLFYERKNVREYLKQLDLDYSAFDLAEAMYPLPDGKADLIVATEVIEHLPFNLIPVFTKLRSALKKGGYIYISTPNGAAILKRLRFLLKGIQPNFNVNELVEQCDPTKNMSVGLHWREYSKKELVELLNSCDFEVEKIYTHAGISNNEGRNVSLKSRILGFFRKILNDDFMVVVAKRC